MLEETQLVEVSSDSFSCVVVRFDDCDFEEAMKIIDCYYSDDKQGAFDQALRMFVAVLADDKLEEFRELPSQEIVELVTEWMIKK